MSTLATIVCHTAGGWGVFWRTLAQAGIIALAALVFFTAFGTVIRFLGDW